MKSNNHSKSSSSRSRQLLPTKQLTLLNDEINSFDYVMDVLIEVCEHDAVQAEQCAYLAHHKGSVDVKTGTEDYLRPMRNMLIDRGLNVIIE